MAYAAAELNLAISLPGGGPNLWIYENSADDGVATVRGAGYFTDGDDKGMEVGDFVVSNGAAGVGQVYKVSAVTAGGAATVT